MRWFLATSRDILRHPVTGKLIPLAPAHVAIWRWFWEIEVGVRPEALLAILPRGGGKSTTVERAVASLGARGKRKYALYVCGSQPQADDHLANIKAFITSDAMRSRYPAHGYRKETEYGHSAGWRSDRIHTADGVVYDGIGLDVLFRGAKIDTVRPDIIIFDDIDSHDDSTATVAKKINTITRSLLPAGSADLAVVFVQNLVHADSVVARLAGLSPEPGDFLARRRVIGPVPALTDFHYVQEPPSERYPQGRGVITGGTPTWAGQDLATCQEQIEDFGVRGFRAEVQHDVEALSSGLFKDVQFDHIAWGDIPWSRIVAKHCWLDPAVSNTDKSDKHGIQIDALADDGTIYRLFSWEERASPRATLERAIRLASDYGCDLIGVETDQGGDLWAEAYASILGTMDPAIADPPRFQAVKAGQSDKSKIGRWNEMLLDYEVPGRIVHALTDSVHVLEAALRRVPERKPYDLIDAAWHSWHALRALAPVARMVGRPVETTVNGRRGYP